MPLEEPRAPAGSENDAFFQLSSDLLAVTDGTLKFLTLNPAWKEQFGYSQTILGRSLLDVIAPVDRERVSAALTSALASKTPRTFDAGILRTSQHKRDAHFTASPHPESHRLYIVARDVTVRRRLEKELTHAQKLEAIGQLAAGVAHEINTPLQFVGDNLSFVGDGVAQLRDLFARLLAFDYSRAPSGETWAALGQEVERAELDFMTKELPQSVIAACDGVDRVAQLVRGLREFAHADAEGRVPSDLNRAIERAVTLSRNEWKYVADVKLELGELPLVPCHVGAINQVILNIVCNAAHAIADKQQRTGAKDKGVIRVSSGLEENFATIAVQDDGTGIPPAVAARIFEPFFTTKELGRGTGQGLAICRTIVCERHRGRLDFTTEVGRGTTFFVRIPIQLEPDEEAPHAVRAARR